MQQKAYRVILATLLALLSVAGGAALIPIGDVESIQDVIASAISDRLISGAVVCVGTGEGVVFEQAYGGVEGGEMVRPLAADAIFDVASLTKVVATAPVVMKLVEEGRLRLDQPVATWFSEFGRAGSRDVTVAHLLTHTSGFVDFPLASRRPLDNAVERAARQKPKEPPGERFHYADINFILLGELIKKATEIELDRWAKDSIFSPTEMRDTCFRPTSDKLPRCVPTSDGKGGFLVGQVQDLSARQLGGVAGHSGVFSTARDLSLFSRMIMHEGEAAGRQVLGRSAVREMLARRSFGRESIVRGLGWDMASPYASPRGNAFSDSSFGHTGYSGSSLWIDPAQDTFVVLLTSRLDFKRTADFSRFRARVSEAAVRLAAPLRSASKLDSSKGWTHNASAPTLRE